MNHRKFKRIWGKPWDYYYLLRLEQAKMKEMCKYFKKTQLVEGWEVQVRDLTLCIKLLDIILKEDYSSKYINIKNHKRFIIFDLPSGYNPPYNNYLKGELRIMKAFHLYEKIRLQRLMNWAD